MLFIINGKPYGEAAGSILFLEIGRCYNRSLGIGEVYPCPKTELGEGL